MADLFDLIERIYEHNQQKRKKLETRPRRKPGGPRKLTWDDVCWIRERAPYVTQAWLADLFEVSPSLISKILSRKTWTAPPPKHVADDRGSWRMVS